MGIYRLYRGLNLPEIAQSYYKLYIDNVIWFCKKDFCNQVKSKYLKYNFTFVYGEAWNPEKTTITGIYDYI